MTLPVSATAFSTPLQPDFATLRAPLLDLWQRNLPEASAARCDWLYGSGHARAWLLPGEVTAIGAAGLMLRRLWVNRAWVEGGGAIDLNVDKAQRSVGPALQLVRAVVQSADAEGWPLLYGMPNRAATAVMKRAGYQQLGEFSSWTRVLDVRPQLTRRLRSRVAATVATPLVNAALRMRDLFRAGLPAGLEFETPTTFDTRFDRLSVRAAAHYDVMGERAAEFLKWRFDDCPDVDYRIFALVHRQDRELAGYLVWYSDPDGVSISDLLTAEPSLIGPLLEAFARQMRRSGVPAIRFYSFGPPDFYETLKQCGFLQRQNRHPVLCRAQGGAPVSPQVRWYLTMADSDTDV